jgi:hypothetical protein
MFSDFNLTKQSKALCITTSKPGWLEVVVFAEPACMRISVRWRSGYVRLPLGSALLSLSGLLNVFTQ